MGKYASSSVNEDDWDLVLGTRMVYCLGRAPCYPFHHWLYHDPHKQIYIDPDFEEDLREACTTGEEWPVLCARRAIQLGLGGRPVCNCLACGKLHLAGKGFCWIKHCLAFYLFSGVAKTLINDDIIRDAIARSRAKVARVSESMPPLAAPAVEVILGSERTV